MIAHDVSPVAMFVVGSPSPSKNSDLKLNSIQCSENTGRQCRVLIVVFTESSPNQVQQRQFIKSIFLGARILRNENNTHLRVDALANKLKSSKIRKQEHKITR